MTSPSDLALLRVYIPEDLLDELHGLAREHNLSMRKVVRGILELGLPRYRSRWRKNLVPAYEDGLSDRPYQDSHGIGKRAARLPKDVEEYIRQRWMGDRDPYVDDDAEREAS